VTVNMNQILQTFIEETLEMLQLMETASLDIEISRPDPEKINLIFRVIHTAKSGFALIGYNSLSKYCHTLENLLQKIRIGEHQMSQFDVNLFFATIDFLRTAMDEIAANRSINESTINELLKKVYESLQESEQESHAELSPPPASQLDEVKERELMTTGTEIEALDEKSITGWEIHFSPSADMLKLGNSPHLVFQQLQMMGPCSIDADTSQIPVLEQIDPKKSYLSWTIQLKGQFYLSMIKDMFAWIADEENLVITPLEQESIVQTQKDTKTLKQEPLLPQEAPSSVGSPPATPLAPSIRVPTEKIDVLMNIIGELVITQSMLTAKISKKDHAFFGELEEGLSRLTSHSRELQDIAMRMRMVPVDYIFSRLPRTVHDLSTKLKKQANLVITGENTEIDKVMMEKMADPLLHLIRNSIDHGIEIPYIRQKKGKSATGTISLNAYHEGGNIIINVTDDGAGIDPSKIKALAIKKGLITDASELSDEEVYRFIFQPGFSTADKVTAVSGRGVGLDVVYRNVIEAGGTIDIQSILDVSTTFRLRLPLTVAILDCQLIRIHQQFFIVPLLSIVELLKLDPKDIVQLDKPMELYHLRENYIQLIYLNKILGIPPDPQTERQFLIVVEVNHSLYGLVCDELLAQQQIVIKNVEDNYQKIPHISGASILGTGNISLILDIRSIVSSGTQSGPVFHAITDHSDKGPTVQQELWNLSDEEEVQLLIFELDKQLYGINILQVEHMQQLGQITPIPHTPSYIKGFINLRGLVVPIIDLRERFDLSPTDLEEERTIIVLKVPGEYSPKVVGIIVDKVHNSVTKTRDEIKPVLENNKSALSPFVVGLIDGELMAILLKLDGIFRFEGLESTSVQMISP
jgi:two-component system chemotaxis sensor kinase CheA